MTAFRSILAAAIASLTLACGSAESESTSSAGASGASGSAGSSGGAGSGGSAGSAGCDVSQVSGLVVAEIDLDAFPPYALDGCQLLYVAAASGELVLRDLATGSESTIAPAAQMPRRPTLAGSTLAWEATENGKRAVLVSTGGNTLAVSGPFDHAGEPRAAADAVVFTAWLGADDDADSDVYLLDVGSGAVALIGSGPAQQRFADVSTTHVAYSDFAEDPNGFYAGDGSSLSDVVLVTRDSAEKSPLPMPGKQAFPMLGSSGVLGFLEWVMVHPIPKLQAYTLKSVSLADATATPTAIADVESEVRVRPSAQAGLFEWVVRWEGTTTLYRAPLDGSAPPVAIPVSADELHAPVANPTTTVLAIRPTSTSAPELAAIPR